MTERAASSAMPERDPGAENMRGILAMVASMFCFNTNDMLIKLVAADLPTGQIVFLRGILATGLIAALAWWRGELRPPVAGARGMFAWRTASDAVSTVMFLTALFHMSLATATAILQSLPIVMTVISAVFLGEVVRWRRWAAVLVGFAGVLMIIQPGTEGFNAYSLLALASLGFITLRDVSTRYIPRSVPTLTISLFGSLAVMLAGGALSATEEWAPVEPRHWLLMSGAACFLIGGYVFIVQAMRSGDLSTVAPFRYTIILVALLYSYLVFGEVPNLLALTGIALVVASGVYVFHREGQLGRKPAALRR